MIIEHVAMFFDDLEKARDFFIKYFGASSNEGYHNETTDFRSYFLSFDSGARLEIMNKPGLQEGVKEVETTGYSHVAFSVGSRQEVDRLTALFKEDGFEVLRGPRTTGDGYYESCIVDLEGNSIEITV
ncbi:MAG: VOC family protein [Lachnospiraceae bacterium]|nr:VOC family protein [Lachnospiraceae bacterium]